MKERPLHLLPAMALLLVGLVLGTCVTALAATGSTPTGACGPGTAEEIGSVKAPVISLWALAEPAVVLPIELFTSTGLLPPSHSPIRLELPWRNFVSRAPPLS